ncbi:MAG: hypothetical protein KatS3mg051_0526 [Anaerolineae bacterium]|nr:MAG: hypothetical protein KatS3mg051_0526 [Anaerolineae bacterium]
MNRQFSRDEVALLRLFKRIQMRPSQHFYERMAAAPWSLHSSPANARPSFARLLATVVSVAVVLFLIAVPLRSLAQQVFHYFTQAETDVIENPFFWNPLLSNQR